MTFSKKLLSNSLPPGKNVRSNITEILAREMICGHGHEQKFNYPYPRDSKIIQMPYPRAKAIDQNPALCPASPSPQHPLRRLDIDRCITNDIFPICRTTSLSIPGGWAEVLFSASPRSLRLLEHTPVSNEMLLFQRFSNKYHLLICDCLPPMLTYCNI